MSGSLELSPPVKFKAVTPSDTVDFDPRPRAVRVNVAGTVALVDSDGAVEVIDCEAGEVIDLAITRINATGTTASGFLAYF